MAAPRRALPSSTRILTASFAMCSSTWGFRVSAMKVERIPAGWHVVIADLANHALSTHFPDGPAALVRTAVTNWVLNQP